MKANGIAVVVCRKSMAVECIAFDVCCNYLQRERQSDSCRHGDTQAYRKGWDCRQYPGEKGRERVCVYYTQFSSVPSANL